MKMYSEVINSSEMKFDPGLQQSYDLPNPQNVQAILHAALPEDVSEGRAFPGMCTHYDEYVKGYASYTQPHFQLPGKSSEFGLDTQDCEDASEDLKLVLTKAPVLRRLESSLTYVSYKTGHLPLLEQY